MPNKRQRKRRAKQNSEKVEEKIVNESVKTEIVAESATANTSESLPVSPECENVQATENQMQNQKSTNLDADRIDHKSKKKKIKYEVAQIPEFKPLVHQVPAKAQSSTFRPITNKHIKQVEIQEINSSLASSRSNSGDNLDALSNYRVESPKTVVEVKDAKNKTTNSGNPIVKSKSFDDILDGGKQTNKETFKITELRSGDELSDDEVRLTCNEAVISETDSDIDWETTEELEPPNVKLSSQEEAQLKYFIEKLNLPGTSGVRVDEVLIRGDPGSDENAGREHRSSHSIRQKRSERREQLMQYFAPAFHNPRFLEAINEEEADNMEKHTKESVVSVVKVVEPTKAELVILDSSSSGDEEETEESSEEREESGSQTNDEGAFEDAQQTPPGTPVIPMEVTQSNINLVPDENNKLTLVTTETVSDCDISEVSEISNNTKDISVKPQTATMEEPILKSKIEIHLSNNIGQVSVDAKPCSNSFKPEENLFENVDEKSDIPTIKIDFTPSTQIANFEEITTNLKEINSNAEVIPPEPPKRNPRNVCANGDAASSKENRSTENQEPPEQDDIEIIKNITIKEEITETTKESHTFDVKVKKIYESDETHNVNDDIETDIAEVEEKILKTEKKILEDQKLIDELQTSLEQDQQDIAKAQEEIQHLKSFEKEFKDVLEEKQRMSISPERDRSASRSSDSSISSNRTTVLFNPSMKDIIALAAEVELATSESQAAEKLIDPRTLKEYCLNALVQMPFGRDALEELASVSDSLKEFMDSLPKIAYHLTNRPSMICNVNKSSIVTEKVRKHETDQQESSEELHLDHNSFTRTTHSEDTKTTNEETIKEESHVEIKQDVDLSASKRLLDIIMREKLGDSNEDIRRMEESKETEANMELLQELQQARLQAKDMREWLTLARTGPKRHPRCSPVLNPRTDDANAKHASPPQRPPRRRSSLPPELHVKQMQQLIEKEKQIQRELEHLEQEKRTLINQMLDDKNKERPHSLPPHEELRQRMYEEYQRQLAEREERKHAKVIKISLNGDEQVRSPQKSKDFNEIQLEFMKIVKERKKNHHLNGNTEDKSRESSAEKSDLEGEKVMVLDGSDLSVKKVPKHLKEFFVESEESFISKVFTKTEHTHQDGIWSPGQKTSFDREELKRESTQLTSQESLRSDEGATPLVWTPKSAGSSPIAERKEFRAVNFESPVLPRKNRTKSDGSTNVEGPWKSELNNKNDDSKKLPTSQSAPGPGFGSEFTQRLPKAQNPTITLLQKAREGQIPPKSASYIDSRKVPESPYGSQSDIIYNLRTESVSDSDSERPRRIQRQVKQYDGIGPTTTHGMPIGLRSEIRDANMSQWYKKMYDTIHKHRPYKYDDEEYVTIRYKQRNKGRYPFSTGYLSEPEAGAYDSDVASENKYATLDRRRNPPYGGSNTNVASSYQQTQDIIDGRYPSYSSSTLPNSRPTAKPAKAASINTLIPFTPEEAAERLSRSVTTKRVENKTTTINYKPEVQQTHSAITLNKPGRIENYTPGKSSISDTEAKKWLDEVMDIFDGWLDEHSAIICTSRPHNSRSYNLLDHVKYRRTMEKQQFQQKPMKVPLVQPKGHLSQALKESGYESDSTLIFRRRDETAQQLNPVEQREVYKNIQKGGDVPLHGLRKVVPERPKEDEFEHVDYNHNSKTRLRDRKSASIERIAANSRNSSRSRSRSSSSNYGLRSQQILCYPIVVKHDNLPHTFATYKRSAPSVLYVDKDVQEHKRKEKEKSDLKLRKPPSPPRRKSSRNNTTLRMIHNVKTPKTTKSIGLKRHETCFSPISKPVSNTNVKVLREKLTSKLANIPGAKVTTNTTPLRKPEVKKKIAEPTGKCYCTKTRSCGRCTTSPQRSQATKSPVEVKRAVVHQINTMNGKSSKAILANINGNRLNKSKNATKSTTISALKKQKSPVSLSPMSASVGSSRTTLKSTSMDSLRSTKPSSAKTAKLLPKVITSSKEETSKKLKKTKVKKELLNSQMKTETLNQIREEPKKVVEKAAYVPKTSELQQNQPDGFFQQLFFGPRDSPDEYKIKYALVTSQNTRRSCDPTLGALKLYLNHTKPVTESRFKYLDMIRSRSTSPGGWHPCRYDHHERSISLPPKLIFTQTSRPPTPTFERKKLSLYKSPEREPRIEKLIFTQTSRPVSPVVVRRARTPSTVTSYGSFTSSPCPSPSEILYFSETSRPVSPIVVQQPSPRPQRPISPIYQPPGSPKTTRSPSYRKIKQKSIRVRASSVDSEPMKNLKFQELNKFYQDLERLGELERTASWSDLRPRLNFENDMIDYDRWQELRQRERAERELSFLYRQLKHSQKENNFLFKPKSIECYKWRRDLDRGLRIKERSVENLREEFEKIRKDQLEKDRKLKEELKIKRGVYKSLWRGNSVVNLAHTLVDNQRSKSESRVGSVRQKVLDNEALLTHGIGSRIWSSLSLEQVNILKNQLSEIYCNDKRFVKPAPALKLSLPKNRDNTIEVALNKNKPPRELRVRRNSDTTEPQIRSKSAGYAIEKSYSTSDVKTKGSGLSEDEKKKLSKTLSKEMLDLQLKKKNTNVIKAKETLGAIAAADAHISDTSSPRTCYSLEVSEDDQRRDHNQDFLLVLTKDDSKAHKDSVNETLEIWAKPKPCEPEIRTNCLSTLRHERSETESGSTDGSTKTVIYKSRASPKENPEKKALKANESIDEVDQKDSAKIKKEKILEKVEYFENRDKEVYTPTVYKPSDIPVDDIGDTRVYRCKIRRSQSSQDLRELYGESNLHRITTEPLSASRKVKYSKPRSPVLRSTYNRCRSLSPDEKYGSLRVHDLCDKFEQYYNQKFTLRPRRCASDPQLSKLFHEGEKVTELRLKFEYPKVAGRGRSRVRKSGLISSSYLKAEDRYMPHINIISKIATLYPKAQSKETSRSSEDLAKILGIPVGEVHKLRERFESPDRQMSILGHMFTSSPNINELRDVAQYLTGNWYAHKYPKAAEEDVIPKSVQRPKSTSPMRPKSKLASILKLPTRHRNKEAGSKTDKCRFIPFRSWWSPSSAKHSVHFKEPEGPPPPPPASSELDRALDDVMQEQKANDTLTESPRKYVENEVTIHYRTPVRHEVKEIVDEQELARRQADAMRKIYEEERQRKHLQVSHSDNELQDRRSRRHTDNFIPSQKSPIPLNRYDDFLDEIQARQKPRPRSPEPRLVAKALFNFVGQSARELTFKKGDIIYIRRQIDKNWYEGELNAMFGLFPANYVEIVPYDGMKTTPRKPNEGQARAKYNFIAQSHLELSLAKGELVVVTRRVDDNWFEGKIGGRKGIFPVSYVEILVDPQDTQTLPPSTKPVASPAAHSMLLNGSAGGKESMGSHNYVPTFPTQDLGMSYRAKPVQVNSGSTYGSLKKNPIDQALHIDIQNDPIPYKALYKYKPQNEDELELLEGDVVQVLEKCDDGWYVGTSERTGAFGTFPGNYVERIAS